MAAPRRLGVERDRCTRSEVDLTRDELRYLVEVLRLGVGDRLIVFDGRGSEADAEVVTATRRRARVRIGTWRSGVSASRTCVHLICALLKGSKMDWVVQKTTELGITSLQPFSCERSVPTTASASRHMRWQRIARDACRQCGRSDVPRVEPLRSFTDTLAAVVAPRRLMLDPDSDVPMRSHLAGQNDIAIVVGPEGGLTATEANLASSAGFVSVSLGDLVLRAETAAIAACAALLVLS